MAAAFIVTGNTEKEPRCGEDPGVVLDMLVMPVGRGVYKLVARVQ